MFLKALAFCMASEIVWLGCFARLDFKSSIISFIIIAIGYRFVIFFSLFCSNDTSLALVVSRLLVWAVPSTSAFSAL